MCQRIALWNNFPLSSLCGFWESSSQHIKHSICRTILVAPLSLILTITFFPSLAQLPPAPAPCLSVYLCLSASLYLFFSVYNLSSLLVFYSFSVINSVSIVLIISNLNSKATMPTFLLKGVGYTTDDILRWYLSPDEKSFSSRNLVN